MQEKPPSHPLVPDALRRAGVLHSRQRAWMLVARAAFWIIVAIPVLMLADVLLHFSEHGRLAGGVGLAIASLTVVAVAMGVAIFARPPLLRVARLLESRNPELGSKLVNILQLEAEADREDLSPLTRQLARQAVSEAGRSIDLPALAPLVKEPQVKRRSMVAIAAVGAVVLLTLFGGPHVRQEWLRFLDPYGDHPPFSLTHLEILSPKAGATVLYDGSQLVEVRATGHQPRELFVTATPVGDEKQPVTLPMAARGDGTFVARFEHLRDPMMIVSHTRDRETLSHQVRLDLILTPKIGPAMVRITPPEYTGLKPRVVAYRFTAMQVLEGSGVAFKIESNRPLGKGGILFESGGDAPETFPLQPESEGPLESVRAEFTAAKSGRLSFSVVDLEGNRATETPTANLTVTRDLPPSIAITVPEADALVVEGFKLPVTVEAGDDYGLHSVRLHIGINDKFLPLEPEVPESPNTKRHRSVRMLDLAEAGARAGDPITLFAEAVDNRPDPQITRTGVRRMEVISEEDYNDRLREKADVAMIAGKYEELLKRFEEQIAEQNRIEQKITALRERAAKEPGDPQAAKDFTEAFADQDQLNRRLEQTAKDMADFGRDEPVYDFEKDLHEKLHEQAEVIRESIAKNREDGEQALEKGDPPPQPSNTPMMEGMEKAAREQRERLQGGSDKAQKEIEEPLADLAQLHELMKDFNRFQQLAEEQRELAEQTKAYQDKEQPNAEDRLALRELGARQRELAPKLHELSKKLRHDAEAAKEKLPEAAGSADQLADQIEAADLPGLARKAAQSLLDGKAGEGHGRADNLSDQMDRLFDGAGEQGQQGLAQGLDRTLQLNHGMKPGDSLRQMMKSRNFRPLPGEGSSGGGEGGMMASSAVDGEPKLLGGEALLDGPIADSIAGRGDQGGAGSPGTPTARLDRVEPGNADHQSARRTDTPGTTTLLLEYENIADAYFRRLTTKP